jgi:hypothetical protein
MSQTVACLGGGLSPVGGGGSGGEGLVAAPTLLSSSIVKSRIGSIMSPALIDACSALSPVRRPQPTYNHTTATRDEKLSTSENHVSRHGGCRVIALQNSNRKK